MGSSVFKITLSKFISICFLSVYIGDLFPIFSAFSKLAIKGDVFIFTVEENIRKEKIEKNEKIVEEMKIIDGEGEGRGEAKVNDVYEDISLTGEVFGAIDNSKTGLELSNWILQTSGRFAHSEGYIYSLVDSFKNLGVVSMTHIVPRKELGVEIKGLLVAIMCE